MKAYKYIDQFILILIVLNVVAMILESHQSLRIRYQGFFNGFELVSISIFSIEYIYRILHNFNKKKINGVFSYTFSFFGLIDLISILPFYLGGLMPLDGRFIRILRLFRIVRIFKLGRNNPSLRLFGKAIYSVKSELYFTLFLATLLILFSASAIYYLENDAQPEKYSSITESIWWATISLTTVGYGDVYPVTLGGKIFATLISLVGIGIVAIPTGIISASFVEQINKKKKYKK